MIKLTIVTAIFAVCIHAAYSQESSLVVHATRITDPPAIDGRVDEEVWNLAPVIDAFIQRDPDDGQPATERTELRILYDERSLYISFICYDDEPEKIISRLTRRDRRVSSDYVAIAIDSYFDRRTAYLFEVNAAGVKRDLLMLEDGDREDVNWDGLWDAAVAMHENGWSAEFRIPFQTLRFSNSSEQIWGFNAARQIERKNEFALWAPLPQSSRSVVSRFGTLRGIYGVRPSRAILLKPYILAGATRWPSNQIPAPVTQIDPNLNVGLDLEYGLSNNSTLNLTINPDFGQVELDEVILNLTAFETFYPERRPFFIEGISLFRTVGALGDGLLRTHMFYTRRIGDRPVNFFALPESVDPNDWQLRKNPAAVPILGAAKVSGKTDGGLGYGLLHATTGRTYKVLSKPFEDDIRYLTQSMTNYSVGRVQYELPGGGSYIGGIATSVIRENGETGRAFSGGIDWQYNINDYAFTTDGLISFTHRATPKGDQVGYHGQLRLGSQSNDHLNGMAGMNIYSRDFNPNDIGFNSYNNFAIYYVWVQLRHLEPFGIVRRINFSQFNFYSHLLEPHYTFLRGIEPYLGITWMNYWYTETGANITASGYNPFESRGMGVYHVPHEVNWWFYSSSDSRKPVVIAVNGGLLSTGTGGWMRRIGLPVTVKAGDRTELTVSPSYRNSENFTGWVNNVEGLIDDGKTTSVFGSRDVEQISTIFRMTHTFTTDLNIQAYIQYFWARGTYQRFFSLNDDGSLSPLENGYDKTQYRNPDFNQSSLNLNFILRYEYLPGSTLFLVWTHSRAEWLTDYNVGPATFLNRTLNSPSTNVLMLKCTYTFGI